MSNSYYSDNKIIANSIALTPRFYYVYKLTVNSTEYFYIGQTGDLSTRLTQHMNSIWDAKHEYTENFLPFHRKAAELLSEQFEKHTEELRYIRKGLSIHIIAYVDNLKYAKAIEKMAIDDNKDNQFCLNMKR